jgi:UDP:flavonoid glycosyltransferase YjiC (YdhE family)
MIILISSIFSVKEAVCAQVPLLAMPLFAEQPYTADAVVKQKIGRVLHKVCQNFKDIE